MKRKITCELCCSTKNLVQDEVGIYLCKFHAEQVMEDRIASSEANGVPMGYIAL